MRCDLRKQPLGDFSSLCLHAKEMQSRNHAHLSPCPLIHKWLRLSLFPSASGHGLPVMILSINPESPSAQWLISRAAAAVSLVFITVSVTDKDKLESLRAAKGSFRERSVLSPQHTSFP